MPGPRRPRWVYDEGDEPDVRFTFANERTFLAWIRTAVTLLAAGVALDTLTLGLPIALQTTFAVLYVALGTLSCSAAYVRWARSERALRRREPLPAPVSGAVLAGTVLLIGCTVAVVILATA
jgi:inner membrane protein YidH